jgi:hypothetical protein
MNDQTYSRAALLAWIDNRIELISQAQHRLARRRTLLQEQATLLRLGAAPDDVRAALRRAGLVGRRRWCRESSRPSESVAPALLAAMR